MITRLYVHNFRCLQNFALDVEGQRSILLIGRNGSGKSTVRHCLTLFQRICRGVKRARDLVSASDFSQHQRMTPMRFEIEAELSGQSFRYVLSLELPPGSGTISVLEEELVVDDQTIYSRKQSQIQVAGEKEFGIDWHLIALPIIHEKPGHHSIHDLKEYFRSMNIVAPQPRDMSGYSEEPSIELETSAANFASCLRALLGQKPGAYRYFETYLKSAIPDFCSIENVYRGETGQQLVVEFKQLESNLQVDFKALSDGEKCFFLSAYFLASNAAGNHQLVLWDELDDHLSISEVGHFVTELRKMANQGGQFIAMSHHPEVIRKFPDEAIFVLTRKSHLRQTVVRPLSGLSYVGDLTNALLRDELIGWQ